MIFFHCSGVEVIHDLISLNHLILDRTRWESTMWILTVMWEKDRRQTIIYLIKSLSTLSVSADQRCSPAEGSSKTHSEQYFLNVYAKLFPSVLIFVGFFFSFFKTRLALSDCAWQTVVRWRISNEFTDRRSAHEVPCSETGDINLQGVNENNPVPLSQQMPPNQLRWLLVRPLCHRHLLVHGVLGAPGMYNPRTLQRTKWKRRILRIAGNACKLWCQNLNLSLRIKKKLYYKYFD